MTYQSAYGTLHSPIRALGNYETAYGSLHTPMRALGALPETTWCSDKNPQGRCTPLVNICKPMDIPTLNIIKEAQRQANAILKHDGKTLLDVDGRIGPLSIRAFNKILDTSYSHCDQAMANLDGIAAQLGSIAKGLGAAPPPDPRPKSPPSQPGPANTVLHPPDDQIRQAGFGAMLKSPLGIAAFVVGGLLIWKSTKKPKRKKKKARRRGRMPRRRVTTSYF